MVGVADKSTVTLRLVLKVIKSGLGKPNLIMQRGTASSMAHADAHFQSPRRRRPSGRVTGTFLSRLRASESSDVALGGEQARIRMRISPSLV